MLASVRKILTPASTTGGVGGETVTVTSIAELQAAVAAEGPAIILVEGAITGGARVDVTSDKTIIGKAGSCKSPASHGRRAGW